MKLSELLATPEVENNIKKRGNRLHIKGFYDVFEVDIPVNFDIEAKTESYNLYNTEIIKFIVNAPITGNLRLTHCQLSEFIINAEINGIVDCSANKLTSIEINHVIKGYFNCSRNPIEKLSLNNIIYGQIVINDTKISEVVVNHPIHNELNCGNSFIKKVTINAPIRNSLYCGRGVKEIIINAPVGDNVYVYTKKNHTLEINAPIGGLHLLDTLRNSKEENEFIQAHKITKLKHGDQGTNVNCAAVSNWIYVQQTLVIYDKIEQSDGFTYYIGYQRTIATDGNLYGMSWNVVDAKEDLETKIELKNKRDYYKTLTKEDTLPLQEISLMFRIYIVAYSEHLWYDIQKHATKNNKDTYTIQEIIDITKNTIGNIDLANTFEKKVYHE
jgi:hypothetical protein